MKRRTILLALGGLAGSSGAAIGSGAFSSTAANRTVSISVAGDMEAYLGIDEVGDGGRSQIDGDTLRLYLPSLGETSPRVGGDPNLGLGTDSVYEFHQDTEEGPDGVEGLFKITNQSPNRIRVYSKPHSSNRVEFSLYHVNDGSRTKLRNEPLVLETGSSRNLGVRVKTYNSVPGNFSETLKIVAESVNKSEDTD